MKKQLELQFTIQAYQTYQVSILDQDEFQRPFFIVKAKFDRSHGYVW
jgi:hypothetical protein